MNLWLESLPPLGHLAKIKHTISETLPNKLNILTKQAWPPTRQDLWGLCDCKQRQDGQMLPGPGPSGIPTHVPEAPGLPVRVMGQRKREDRSRCPTTVSLQAPAPLLPSREAAAACHPQRPPQRPGRRTWGPPDPAGSSRGAGRPCRTTGRTDLQRPRLTVGLPSNRAGNCPGLSGVFSHLHSKMFPRIRHLHHTNPCTQDTRGTPRHGWEELPTGPALMQLGRAGCSSKACVHSGGSCCGVVGAAGASCHCTWGSS